MNVNVASLIASQHAPNAQTTLYTSAAGVRTIIDKFTGYATLAATVTVNLVTSGGSAGPTNVLISKTFAIGDTYTFPELVGHVLAPGDFISVVSTVASAVVLRASGRQVN